MKTKAILVLCCAILSIAVLYTVNQPSVVADENPDVFVKNPKGEIQTVAEIEDLMEDMARNHKLVQTALLKKDFRHIASPARMCAELSNLAELHGKPEQFKKLANDMKAAWLDVAAQAKAEDFEKTRLAFSAANDVCTSCHNIYRPEEDDHHDEEGAEDH